MNVPPPGERNPPPTELAPRFGHTKKEFRMLRLTPCHLVCLWSSRPKMLWRMCHFKNPLAKDEIIANYIAREIYINVRKTRFCSRNVFNSVFHSLFFTHHVKCGIYTQHAQSAYARFVEGLPPWRSASALPRDEAEYGCLGAGGTRHHGFLPPSWSGYTSLLLLLRVLPGISIPDRGWWFE